jgi:hypothetical protein
MRMMPKYAAMNSRRFSARMPMRAPRRMRIPKQPARHGDAQRIELERGELVEHRLLAQVYECDALAVRGSRSTSPRLCRSDEWVIRITA